MMVWWTVLISVMSSTVNTVLRNISTVALVDSVLTRVRCVMELFTVIMEQMREDAVS